jgi:hypothetical protein
MPKRFLLLAALVALLLALASCAGGGGQVAGVEATPVRTLRPLFTSTTTPMPTALPSDTPAPTETPVPTETPLPPDDTPAPTEAPPPEAPTEVPTPQPPPTQPAPTPTARPQQPANTAPPPPTAPPAPTPRPQVDFLVAEIVAFVDGSLSASGLHNIYFTVVDANGRPLDGIVLQEVNNQPPVQVTSGDKGPGKAEFTMWAADYRFKVVGNTGGQALSSETTHVLSVLYEHAVWADLIRGGICTDEAACRALGFIHYSYNVTFRRSW